MPTYDAKYVGFLFFENLAHYTRGMATMSFMMWSVILYRCRKRNRMTFLLFLSVSYIALGYIKDFVFLFPDSVWGEDTLIEELVSIFDLAFVPLVCAFFIEVTSPGSISKRRVMVPFLLILAFVPIYCAFPLPYVMTSVFVLTILMAVITLVFVPLSAKRYNKYINENYSYTKNITVSWCVVSMFCFFIWVLAYDASFYHPTWFGEAVYDGGCAFIWNVVCLMSLKHRVVVGIMRFHRIEDMCSASQQVMQDAACKSVNMRDVGVKREEQQAALIDTTGLQSNQQPHIPATTSEENGTGKDQFIATSLQRCMEEEKIYLNPRLSLNDLATYVGTNKTYISAHINRQGKTFYDFVNEYRIAEACSIINCHNGSDGRLSMAEVAERSGFNSFSSFNRYFTKIKGVTPAKYAQK